MIKIQVPATSANLGTGYDCMGMAVNLFSEFTFTSSEKRLEISGCAEEFKNSSNLVYRAFVRGCEYLQVPVPNLKIKIETEVPVSRGLGSSASCIVGGLVASFTWHQKPIDKDIILKLACEMEGHPDNVSPAIFGGLCMSFIQNEQVELIKYPVSSDLHFLAIIPDFKVSTEAARAILPKQLSYADVTYQVSHALLLVDALQTGSLQKLKLALDDRMQEPYRKKLINNYDNIKKLCDKMNCDLYISGSGSTLMGITDDITIQNELINEIKKLLPKWLLKPVSVDPDGFKIEVH
ncbi:homoserine kinase [Fructilactobacillus vespulae]|uniref:homoserine kinase n=1 Tax=Fructilactobacillus vespulae TaxID=1249630 RepID=UPI0039B48C07